MPYCAAPNCSNSGRKGFRLFIFPRDPKRRKVWAVNCGREPTKHSRLCESHFDENQFEQNRADGQKKLRWNAVPTLFNNTSTPEEFSNVLFQQELNDGSSEAKKLPSDHNYNSAKGSNQPVTRSSRREANKKKDYNEDGTSSEDHGNENTNIDPSLYNKDVHTMCQIRLKKLEDEKESLQRRKYSLDHQVRTVKRKLQNLEISLSKFLNPDQILFLESQKKSGPQINVIWSEETVEIAFHILKVLGPKGYEFLKSALGYPLPAFRTLRRHKGSVQFTGLIPAS